MSTAHKHYFVRGNTALGLYSLVESAYKGLRTVYVLQGYTGGTALILKKTGTTFRESRATPTSHS